MGAITIQEAKNIVAENKFKKQASFDSKVEGYTERIVELVNKGIRNSTGEGVLVDLFYSDHITPVGRDEFNDREACICAAHKAAEEFRQAGYSDVQVWQNGKKHEKKILSIFLLIV